MKALTINAGSSSIRLAVLEESAQGLHSVAGFHHSPPPADAEGALRALGGKGVVKEVHLVVPHSWVYMEVNDEKGEPQIWALEATGRGQLERLGVTREYIKPGDKIKVRCHVLRDGSRGCLLGFLKAADGTVKDWDGGQNTPIPQDF